MAKLNNTRRQKAAREVEILQTGQQAHRHHVARHGSREKYLGQFPQIIEARVTIAEWGGVWGGVSPS